jgi:hypothetical protein
MIEDRGIRESPILISIQGWYPNPISPSGAMPLDLLVSSERATRSCRSGGDCFGNAGERDGLCRQFPQYLGNLRPKTVTTKFPRSRDNDQGWRSGRQSKIVLQEASFQIWLWKRSFLDSTLGHSARLGYESRRQEAFLAACTRPHPCSLVGETLHTLRN